MAKLYAKWTEEHRQRWIRWRKVHMESTITNSIELESDKRISKGRESRVYNPEVPQMSQDDKTCRV